ncbi:deleted in malignant brain tumors 1 protein-like isoform X2 [Mercenaria mercenaria]|uniref:deleted in malignant brain tumors 1 protein-like isoform X2 n=1 Tax=Mercenaria mercenaria TaxID=6596 RepID=UPI00234F0421|nr:deleted in malignant brain tumors 1 protein-like isoform X2 [Mercenaria mercenaria]
MKTSLRIILTMYMYLMTGPGKVTSTMPKAINIRLVGGKDPSQGRIEIQSADGNAGDNPWGTICNDQYEVDNKAATVICRQLGYLWGEGTANRVFLSGATDMPIFLDELDCNGSETSITQCRSRGWGRHNCYHHEDVGAICHNTTVRLQTKSKQKNVGVVQVMYNYKWGDACDDGWNDYAATTVCKELGFVYGIAECCSALGPSEFSNVDRSYKYTCTGNETKLTDCKNTSYRGMCDYSHRASVICHNTTANNVDTSFDIRLSGGQDYWGRVEVRHSGVWGQLCNDRWSDASANVTCKQLGKGFIGGVAFGPVTTPDLPFWLVDVTCKGTESSIEKCNYTQWGEPLLFGCNAAYVLCYKNTGVQVDIVGGSVPSTGRVQITYDGLKGSVCADEEWTDNDAFLVCKMKGYADGVVKSPTGSSANVPPYFLNRLICNTLTNLFMCSTYGWRVKTDQCKQSAHVTCFRKVRLSGGNENAGIVEYFEKDAWTGFCSEGFKPEYAVLVCKELGHKTGSLLPAGAYGSYLSALGRKNLKCQPNDTSIMNCEYDTQACRATQYVSVSCHDDTPDNGPRYQLVGDSPDPAYGRVDIYLHHIWGEVCATGWTDTEADVFCRTLGRGFKGGVAAYYHKRRRTPTLVTEVKCNGNETAFTDCVIGNYATCLISQRAGVVCYKESAPTVYLADGGMNYGRVQISNDDVSGTVCDFDWTDTEASVVCKEINKNFTQGEPYSDFPQSTGDVVIANYECSGLEKSLLECSNAGWRSVAARNCLDHSHDVGVYCYGQVRVMDGKKNSNYVTGRVEILSPTSGDRQDWNVVCGDGFEQADAEVVCREMGFDAAKVLAPGSFGVKPIWKFYTNLTCIAGGSDIYTDCTFQEGTCNMVTHNYASVQCFKSGTSAETEYIIEGVSHGLVIAQQYGMNGTICADDWDDTDADVLCRSKGFKGGVVLGVPEIYTRTAPIWFTDVHCTGKEKDFSECDKNESVPIECSMSLKAAGVLCYKNTGVRLKLVNDKMTNFYGRVEIEVDGQNGTICDSAWSAYDARVTCRQLGFPDGDAFMSSYYGRGTGPVVLSGMTCDSSEKSLLSCPSMGWKAVQSTCLTHKRDAGVRCKRNVFTDQADNYGAVKVWQNGAYYLVCADEFDDREAAVVCRTMGYPFGKSLCCEAFGFQSPKIGFIGSRCTGRESNYNDCAKSFGKAAACSSKQYASVVCSRENPLGIEVGIEEYSAGMGSGPVLIEHMTQKGYVCAENFDDKDATVICKQKGYTGGYAYKYYNTDVRMRATLDLRWMRGPDCNGTEQRLDDCPGIDVGNVSGCFVLSHAAVFCYKTQEQSKFEVRLQNAIHPGEGFVQIKVNNTWGSVCTKNTLISNFEATVVCRQLNFKYGVVIPIPNYPRLNGSVWLSNMNCVGTEATLQECLLSGMGETIPDECLAHKYDMAVKCYANVRVSAAPTPNFGMIQVLNETSNRWVAVCDVDFDDVDARVACRNVGYKDGKAQCCSSLGPKLTYYNPIEVANVQCTGQETDFTNCTKDMSPGVKCDSGSYASVICTDVSPPVEDLQVAISEGKSFGNIEVKRYGVKGAVCDADWDDNDAKVLCRELNFTTGYATNGSNSGGLPMILSSVNCVGSEKSLSKCAFPPLQEGHGCNNRGTRAAVVCSMDSEPIRYRVADMKNSRGRAEIYFDGRWGTICDLYWEDADADVFCRQAGYLGGESTILVTKGSTEQPIWMSHVECKGDEKRFLECRASWDAKTISRCSHYDDAGVKCYNSARLNRGDYRTKRTNGIVEVYVPSTRFAAKNWNTICADTFTDKEAAVVCRVLGHDHGLAVCCSPYGYSTAPMAKIRPKCNGTENQITDCEYVKNDTRCSRQNYASVACYSGTRTQTEYSVSLKGSLKYTGQVVLKYLGVPGRICWTGWSDEDARVVCRELGFRNGSAYYHYKSSFIYLDYNGPYWTSSVKCIGNETQLSECPHAGFGHVKQCEDRGHYAGVICFDETDVAYRISGGNHRYGRVEFTYNGEWHTICSNTWGSEESNVTCRQLGFVTGQTYSGEYLEKPSGKAYAINYRCKGNEENLNDCPHEGFQESTYCQTHKDDEGVFCYTSVKLSGPEGSTSTNGTVLYYVNDTWSLVCDEDFDDVTARKVCRELGFADGRSICCSAYGEVNVFGPKLGNYSLHCDGSEEKLADCLKYKECSSKRYASAVCFASTYTIDENTYTFGLEKPGQGQVEVTYMGVKGRICSRDWDDNEANVFCRNRGFAFGIAYQHSENNVLKEKRGPYWFGGFNCSGDEKTIMDCTHLNRTNLDNCTNYDIASVLCYNESGVEYRLAGGGTHFGRVEVSVGNEWGTVCDQYWDRREAKVFCRQLNFTDGEAIGGAHFGRGSGPIWISHLECKGNEKQLHQCPHRGFANEYSFDWWFPLPCETHNDDAGVYCYKSVRLNSGPTAHAGGLEVHKDGKWYGVCDTGLDLKAARVACRSIKKEYIDARTIPGSAYGNLTGDIGFTNVKCSGDEEDLANCPMDFTSTCTSGHYISLFCSNTTIQDTGFKVRLAPDSLASDLHGILEVRVNGVWGRVCLHDFDDRDAMVACKQFGYDGGIAYLHIMKNDKPVLLRDVQCVGNETTFEQCPSKQMSPDLKNCNYASNDAGVICYRKKNDVGFNYRMVGGSNRSTGRVEIGYEGRWGMVCAWSWQSADARVLCKALGYTDGIVEYTVNKSLTYSMPWVTGFFCLGNEETPMTCLNTGFNSTFLTDLCMGGRDPGAYSNCYNEKVEGKNIRLVNGRDEFRGRVEIYVTGANSWGTICDDYWDEDDAIVVCRQLGYYGGTPLRQAAFGAGTGPIWFDNVKCRGNESTLFECAHRGIGTHNCNHTEDVGVICLESPPITTAITTVSTKTTTKQPSTTTTTTTTKTTTSTTTAPPTTPSQRPPTTPTLTTAKSTSTTPFSTKRATTTTEKKTTSTTTAKSTTVSKSTTAPTTASSTSTRSNNITVSAGLTSTSKANLGVVVALPLVAVLLIIIIVAIVVWRYRRGKMPGYSRERFDDSVISRESDGTLSASNQLYDLNLQPTSSSDISSPGENGNMKLGKNGNAFYSKGLSNGDSSAGAFTNPLYEVSRDLDSTESQNNIEKTLPSNGELTFPESDIFNDHTSA